MRPIHPPILLALLLLLVSAGVLDALQGPGPEPVGGVTVEPAGAPPDGTPEGVGAALDPEGLRVVPDGEPPWELWLASGPPTGAAEPSGGLGRAFPDLPEGAFLGLLHLPEAWTEYSGRRVAPGLYTLRYLLRPEDGNHMGVSVYRDFLLLVPAADDPGPDASPGEDELIELSRGATGTRHPAVLALFPLYDEPAPPAVVANDLGQPTLAVELDGTRLGLVVAGTGEK